MLLDLLQELVLELARTFLLEGLCQHVKENVRRSLAKRQARRRQAFYRWLRSRHSQRLLHRLITAEDEDL
jgi:hypothetical protein